VSSRLFKLFRSTHERPSDASIAALGLLDLARAYKEQGRLADAVSLCEELLRSRPDDIDTLLLLAELRVRSSQVDSALAVYTRVIGLKADLALPYYKRGNLLKDRGELGAALADYDRALAIDPGYAYALCNRGAVLASLERFEAALECYERANAAAPNDPITLFNRAEALRALNRREDALVSYDRALQLNSRYVECHCNRAVLLLESGRTQEALASYDRAIDIAPAFAEAYFGRGTLLQGLHRLPAALADFARALEIDPRHAAAWCNRGVALAELKQDTQALESFGRAAELKPDDATLFKTYANALVRMKRYAEAIAIFDRALACQASVPFVQGLRVHAKMTICAWDSLQREAERIAAGVRAGEAVTPPFSTLPLLDDVSLHEAAARTWVREECPPNHDLPDLARRAAPPRLRVGYFSADLHDHPVSQLMAEVFETHDRSRFEVTAFSYGTHARDAMQQRLESAFDRFLDVRDRSDRDIALLARSCEIDVAVDLNGYTGDGRTKIFAFRAAPVQVNYLGYPATLGADYFDYLVGDRIVVPPEHRPYYAEKIVYLPHCYLPNDSTRRLDATVGAREHHGLPPTGFVFCCFNNSYKITPEVFEIWMRILARVNSSVLWLSHSNPTATGNLRREAARHGIDPKRLVFAERVPSLSAHLARQRLADLFIDTLPYNAHTTAINALWAGLPVLTRIGASFAGRVGASLLTALDLPELITTTVEQFEEAAVQLATKPEQLAGIRQKVERSRLSSPLFDTRAFTRYLELGYTRMFACYQAGLAPEHIEIAAAP